MPQASDSLSLGPNRPCHPAAGVIHQPQAERHQRQPLRLELRQRQTLSTPHAGRSLSSYVERGYTVLLQVFSTSHKLSDINDSYWDFRVEAVPDEELNASAASRTIHVYHIAPQSTAVRRRLAPRPPVWPSQSTSVSWMHWPHLPSFLLYPYRLKSAVVCC